MSGLKHKVKRDQPVLKNPDRKCVIYDKDYKAVSPLQKTCSADCRRTKDKESLRKFNLRNPDSMVRYNKTRKEKNPTVWIEKSQKARASIIDVLGGKCIVDQCGVTNKVWLHIDYIPTMKGTGYRHPRHLRWVMDNIKDFRLLCANHHYELTITGKIEGTGITQ